MLLSFNKGDADSVYDYIGLFKNEDGTKLKMFPFGLDPFGNFFCVKKDGSVVPSGSGDGNVAELLERFKDSGYQGFLSLEPHLINFTGLGSLEKDATERHTALTGEEAFTLAYDSLVSILEKL